MEDRSEPSQDQPQKDDFDRMPRNTWQLFPRCLTVTSLNVFRQVHPKFNTACDIEIDRHHGEDFFSFIFKIPQDQIPPIFVRLAEIINSYFQLNKSPAEYLVSCEGFIRENNHYAKCLDFQQQLTPMPLVENKRYRQNAFLGSMASLFLNRHQVGVILTLLAFRCSSQDMPLCCRVADTALIVKDDDSVERERVLQVFLRCVGDLQYFFFK
jgi:hypothetical protein